MVFAFTKKQNMEPRIKLLHLQSTNIPQKIQESLMTKGLSLQQMMLQKIDNHM